MEADRNSRTEANPALAAEMEALRIQTAAVAAQQMALLEQESRLEKSKGALAQHEAQLASHLEEKRKRLVELRDQCQKARAELQAARLQFERELAAETRRLETIRAELAETQRQALADRHRLRRFRKRLRQRLHRHWLAARQEHEAQRRKLAAEQERCRQDRQQLARTRLEFHGTMEVERRRLADLERSLAEKHSARAIALAGEKSKLEARTGELEKRGAELARGAEALARDKRDWERFRAERDAEENGLENRILNARRKLMDFRVEMCAAGGQSAALEVKSLPRESPQPGGVVFIAGGHSAAPDEERETADTAKAMWAAAGRVLEELADQRCLLAEHWCRLAAISRDWHDEHRAALEALENRRRELDQRERGILADERETAHRREEVDRSRSEVESSRALLRLAASTWESERDCLAANLESREQWVRHRDTLLAELRLRWQERQRQELERWREEMAALADLSDQHTRLCQEAFRQEAVLVHDRRTATESALAMEQFRQEYLIHAANPAAAEKRLEQIRRSWAEQLAREERGLARKQDALRALSAAIEARFAQLHAQAEESRFGWIALARHEEEQDIRLLAIDDKTGAARGELHLLRVQNHDLERQLQDMREEVERLARLLIDQAPPPGPLRARAA